MTYGETTVGQTISRLLSEQPGPGRLGRRRAGQPRPVPHRRRRRDRSAHRQPRARRGDRVLDVGSGFGGPARQIARRTGNRVVGIDITPAYVDAARDLTAGPDWRDLVEFRVGDIATFEPDPLFQAAITMHVQMNVEDKTRLVRADRPLPGPRRAPGRLGGLPAGQPEAGLPWPMPWSFDGTDSFVATAGSLRASIEQGGFTATEWTNETAWVQAWVTKTFANGLPAGPALPMLLHDGYTRVMNFTAALGSGSLEIWRGAFTRNAGQPIPR